MRIAALLCISALCLCGQLRTQRPRLQHGALFSDGVPMSGLQVWVKPESYPAGGSSMASVTNSAPSGVTLAQATSGNQPISVDAALDGYRAMSLTATNRRFNVTGLPAGDANNMTVIMVAKSATPISNAAEISFMLGSTWMQTVPTSRNLQMWSVNSGGSRESFQARRTATYQILGVVSDTVNTKFIRNGIVSNGYNNYPALRTGNNAATSVVSSSAWATSYLPANTTPVAFIVEALLWNRPLDAVEIWRVNRYLLMKYPSLRENNIVAAGDSLTFGSGTSPTGRDSYPNQLAFGVTGGGNTLLNGSAHVINWGFAGRYCESASPTESDSESLTAGRLLFPSERDGGLYNPLARRNILIWWYGTNDFGFGNKSLASLQSCTSTMIALAKSHGWTVVAPTLIPRNDSTYGTPSDGSGNFEYRRAQYNAWLIAGSSGADIVVDLTANTAFDEVADTANTSVYSADLLHLVNEGYGIVAQEIYDAISGIL